MFGVLPFDVVLLVIEDYLEANDSDLSLLDVALCSHKARGDWLDTLTRMRPVDGACPPKHATAHLTWALARSIKLKNLSAFGSSASLRALMDLLATAPPDWLQAVHAICLQSRLFHVNNPMLGKYLACFPSVDTVDCLGWQDMDDYSLKELRHLRQPLKALRLHGCYDITGAMVVTMVSIIGSRLQELCCDVLDDQALVELADCCRCLHTLSIGCSRIGSSESLVDFCSTSSRSLSSLTLHNRGARSQWYDAGDREEIITDAVMEAITSACTQLTYVHFDGYGDFASVGSVILLLRRCAGIQRVILWGADMTFTGHGFPKQCTVKWLSTLSPQTKSEIMDSEELRSLAVIFRIANECDGDCEEH